MNNFIIDFDAEINELRIRTFRCTLSFVMVGICMQFGCGQGNNLPGPSGTVSGKATYKNKPIPIGSAIVLVHDKEGLFGIGATDSNGNFQIKMKERKDVLVGVYSVNIKPPGDPDENVMVYTKKTVPPAWNEIPERYWSPNTSKERFTVKEGVNEYDLVLKD